MRHRRLIWGWLLLGASCASTPAPPPVVAPPPARAIVVVGLGASDGGEICVERPWIGGDAQFDCLTVGELRLMVHHRLLASETR